MTTNPKQKLAELKAKAEAATPGPWSSSGQSGQPGHCIQAQVWDSEDVSLAIVEPFFSGSRATANAAFIAACDPQTILDLISRVEASPAIPSGEQWRPIETCPDSDDDILVCYPKDSGRAVELRGAEGTYFRGMIAKGGNNMPIWWMPKPAPPGSEPIPSEPSGEQIELETTEEERAYERKRVETLMTMRGYKVAFVMETPWYSKFLRDFAKLQARAIPSERMPNLDEVVRFAQSNPLTFWEVAVETLHLGDGEKAEVSSGRLRELWKLAGGSVDKKGNAWIEVDLLPGILRQIIDTEKRIVSDDTPITAAIPSLETPEERQAKIVAAMRASANERHRAGMYGHAAALRDEASAIESGDFLRTGGGE